MKLKIGNVELENNLILAPMAGVTDLPFRLLCKEQGCGLMYTEMVSAKAILYKNRNTGPLIRQKVLFLYSCLAPIRRSSAISLLRWKMGLMPLLILTWAVRFLRS